MKFKVSRTSRTYYGDEKPCDEAKRDSSGKYWEVEISGLPKLMEFIKKYGVIVLTSDEIEIYDDYRE